ncbi:MAG TPA: hypothetical protein VLE97_00060 [Gaiellaceae bacterium]|nr:hypothetical protein [Gaiellaceae bacterium]
MANIDRTTPEDRIKMDRRARMISRKCDECGTSVYVGNLTNLKDGRKVCPTCFDTIFDALVAQKEDAR